ncbi:MAG: YdcF family protein [Deltaproteobacteria bacterium]
MARRVFLGLLAGLLLVGLLPWIPSLLERRDAMPEHADAIYVLPGKLETRARCAARLHAAGKAPWLLFTGARVRPELRALGYPLSDAAVGAEFATRAGVARKAQIVLPLGRSTWEDAGAVADWARQTGLRKIIAVTSPTHARRAGESLRLALAPLGGEVWVTSCESLYTPAMRWWWYETPLIEVNNEFIKLGLYTFRYFIPTWLGLRPPPGSSPEPAAAS